ncbi:MAG TPA: DUF5069 domain-containing protein [Candidatus Elarobacter sp.]|jgi:hypothetical protein|nr:DUF5069 domain-containing protein [Candidatus Elarobacter sp.]
MWIPRSAHDSLEGLPWLPRLLEKARRFEAGRAAGTDLMNGYLYGDNDFIDAQLLRFLRTTDATVSALVRDHADDAEVARILVERSGRSPSEIAEFAKIFPRKNFGFVLTEADEGRLGNGPRAKLICFVYNRLIMPIFYAKFAADERKRATRMATG